MQEPAGTKGVILCADDFAVHASASRGIAKLVASARLSATSVMVLSPRWPQDVALLQELRGQIDVGLHLDWTSEFAIAAGHGMTLGAAMRKALLGGLDPAMASVVIERQLDAFEAHWKAVPDYVDGHQHVQQFAGIRQALVQVLSRRYGGSGHGKPYVRVSRAPPGARNLKSWVISAMGANALEKIAASAPFQSAPALLGAYDFAGDEARYAQLMDVWLGTAPPASIIMCHPALAAEPGDVIGSARSREYAYLSGEAFPQALVRHRVQLIRGGASGAVVSLAAKIRS